jgi:hypothetical protein
MSQKCRHIRRHPDARIEDRNRKFPDACIEVRNTGQPGRHRKGGKLHDFDEVNAHYQRMKLEEIGRGIEEVAWKDGDVGRRRDVSTV